MAGLTKAQRAEKKARLEAEAARQETPEEVVALPGLSPPQASSEEPEEVVAVPAEVPIEFKTSGELKRMLVGEDKVEGEVRRRVDLEVARRRSVLGAKKIVLKQDRELHGLLTNKNLSPYDRLLVEHELAERKAGRSSAPKEQVEA